MRWGAWVLGFAVLLTVAVAIGYLAELWRPPSDVDSLSTYSTDPGGTAAYYRLLRDLGYDVSRSGRRFGRTTNRDALLIVLFPSATPQDLTEGPRPDASPELLRELVALAGDGRRMLLFGLEHLRPDALAVLGLSLVVGRHDDPLQPVVRELGDLPPIDPTSVARLRAEDAAWIPLLASGDNGYVVARPYASGRIVACVSSSPFTNAHIAEAGHGEWALRLVEVAGGGTRRVAFDEYMHGYDEDSSLWSRIGPPGQLALAQLLLAFLVVVFSVGRRFGYALVPRGPRPPVGEYVNAMALLYERAQAPGLALRTVHKWALRTVGQTARVPPSRAKEELQSRMPGSLRRALDAVEAAAGRVEAPDLAAKLVRTLDREIDAFRTAQASGGRVPGTRGLVSG
jgi:hypothetical protein